MSLPRIALAGAALMAVVALPTVRAADAENVARPTPTANAGSMASMDGWPAVAQKAYKEMQQKYGEPDERTATRMVWSNKAPFAEIVLLKAAIPHKFPVPHEDCLEHKIAYRVPAEKVGELGEFDGSLIVDRTHGVMSARCDTEAHNLFALNLADDIMKGKKTVAEARKAYGEAAMQEKAGTMPALGKSLQFQPVASVAQAGDPDMTTVGPDAQPDEAKPAAARQPAERPERQPALQPEK